MAILLVMQLTVPFLMLFFIHHHVVSATVTGIAAWMFFSIHQVFPEPRMEPQNIQPAYQLIQKIQPAYQPACFVCAGVS